MKKLAFLMLASLFTIATSYSQTILAGPEAGTYNNTNANDGGIVTLEGASGLDISGCFQYQITADWDTNGEGWGAAGVMDSQDDIGCAGSGCADAPGDPPSAECSSGGGGCGWDYIHFTFDDGTNNGEETIGYFESDGTSGTFDSGIQCVDPSITTLNSSILLLNWANDETFNINNYVVLCWESPSQTGLTETDISGDPDDGEICAGDPFNLEDDTDYTSNSTANISYAWSSDLGSASFTGDALVQVSGAVDQEIITLTVTDDDSGCTSTATYQIIVAAGPTIVLDETDTSGAADDDGIICEGDTFTLTESGGDAVSHMWTITGTATPDGDDNPELFSGASDGDIFLLTATDVAGCTSTEEYTIMVSPLPIPTDPDLNICTAVAMNYDLTANDGVVGTGTITWWDGDPDAGGIDLSPATDVDLTALAGSLYAQETNTGGCSASVEVTLNLTAGPTGDISVVEACENGNLILQDNTGLDIIDWLDPAMGSLSSTDMMITISTAATTADEGTYTVIVSDTDGCTGTGTFDVVLGTAPTATIQINEACENGNLILEETEGATIVDWLDGSMTSLGVTDNPYTISTDAQIGTDDGDYYVVVTDGNGCTGSSMISVVLNAAPAVGIMATPDFPLCSSETVALEDTGGEATTWMWSTDLGTAITDNGDGTAEVAGLTDGEVITLEVTDGNGCTSSSMITATILTGPANDDCGAAIDASGGSASGTTDCASPDANMCGASGDQVVYYTYTTAATGDITIEVAAGTAGDIGLEAWTDCGGGDYDVANGDCGTMITLSCVPEGTSLTIPVGSSAGNGGTFDLTISEAGGTAPAENVCDNAIEVAVATACTPVSASGDTTGACPETGPTSCSQATDPTIWFTVTTLAGTTSMEFTNLTGEFQVYAACPGNVSISGCISGDMGVTVDPGTQYWISATVNGGAGAVAFDLALLEAPTNDNCGAAEDASGGSAAGSTACASADGNMCGASGDHVVYYSYTTTSTGDVTISVTPDGAGDVAVEAWTDCGGSDYDAANGDCQAEIILSCVPAGTNLIIPVGSATGGEGTFNLTITEAGGTGPANDLCDGATDIVVALPCTPVSASGDTTGACPENFTAGCTQDVDATVWFTVTTLGGTTSMEFSNLNGEFQVFSDCPPTTSVSGCITGDMGVTVDPGTQYWISATVNGSEGAVAFDIALLEAPANDNCAEAEDASGGSVTGSNACASADPDLCGGTDHVVYYTYTVAGPGVVTLDITATAGTAGALNFSAILGCGGTEVGAACGGGDISLDCVAEGTVIVIPIGTATGDEGDFTVDIAETPGGGAVQGDACDGASPVNALDCEPTNISGTTTDACPELFPGCGGIETDPTVWFEVTLPAGATMVNLANFTGGVSIGFWDGCGGTEEGCFTADTDGVAAGGTIFISAVIPGGDGDFSFELTAITPPENDLCSDAIVGSGGGTTCCATNDGIGCSNENTVWHMYTPADPDATITITVENVSIGGAMGVDIWIGDCSGPTTSIADCQSASIIQEEVVCMEGDIYVQVSTVDNNSCGDYSVTFLEESGACTVGVECGSDIQLSPTTNGGEACGTACNIGVCTMDCGQGTVWFEIMTDMDASAMVLSVDAEFTPALTMLQGDCGGGAIIPCGTGENFTTAVSGNQIYYVGVGSADGSTGEITLCVQTILEFAECSAGELTVTRPEYPDLPAEGPFCSGEKVNFCYDLDFTVDEAGQGNNCQWLQGIVPALGGGWDTDACPIELANPGSGAFWLDEGEVDYLASFSVFGIGANCNGETILEFGTGVGPGTGLPGGWWFVSNGGGPDCTNNGNPNTMWGLSAGCGGSSSISFCFDLQTRVFADAAECLDPCAYELGVSMFVFADGQTGCWSNNFCAADQPTEFVEGDVDCSGLILIEGPEEAEVCSGDQLDLEYTPSDGVADITIAGEGGPNISGVSGETTYSGGSATLQDILVNSGTDPEDVIYTISAAGNSDCAGPPFELIVTVFPEIMIEFEEPYDICWDGEETITPMVSGGDGVYSYEWSNGSTGSSIDAPETIGEAPGTYTYVLTVTDDLGCSSSEEVEYTIHPESTFEIEQIAFFACVDGNDDGHMICLNTLTGASNEPFEYDWVSVPGGLSFSNNDECITIDDESSSAGFYEITATITDQYDCVTIVEGMEFTIEIGPEIGEPEILCIENNDGELTYTVEICDENGDPAEWTLYDENFISVEDGPLSGSCVTFTVTPFELGDQLPFGYGVEGESLSTGCFARFLFQIDPPPVADLPEEITGCIGDEATITIQNYNEFEAVNWCDGSVDVESITFIVEEDDVCTIEIYDGSGCSFLYEVEIFAVDPAEALITGATEFCQNTTTTLSTIEDSDYEYDWSSGDDTAEIEIDQGGTYSVTVTNSGGCTATADFEVTEGTTLEPFISGFDFCEGEETVLSVEDNYDLYVWFNADTGDELFPDDEPYELIITEAGTYGVSVEDAGCAGESELEIFTFPAPMATVVGASPCNSNTNGNVSILDLTTLVTDVVGDVTYLDENGIPIANPAAVDFNGETAGMYLYMIEVDEPGGPCDQATYDMQIQVLDCACPSPEINSLPNYCNDVTQVVDLNGFILPTTDPDGSLSILDAAGVDTGIALPGNMLTIDGSIAAGTYTLQYTLNNPPAGCPPSDSETFEVSTPPVIAVDVASEVVCNSGATGESTIVDLTDNITYAGTGSWTDATGTAVADPTNLEFDGAPVGTLTFTFTSNDAQGECNNNSVTVTIQIADCDCPTIGILDLPTPLCVDSEAFGLGAYLVAGTEQGTWVVDGPDGSFNLGQNAMFEPDLSPGIYTLTYSLTDTPDPSCTASVNGTIEIFEPPVAPMLAEVELCGSTLNPILPTAVDLENLVPAGITGTWTAPANYNGGVIPDVNNVEFLDTLPKTFVFTFTTDIAQAPCMDDDVSLFITVLNCDCPIISIAPTSSLCTEGSLTAIDLQSVLSPATAAGTWSYEMGAEPTVILDGTSFDAEGLAEGDYIFTYSLDDPIAGCDDTGMTTVTVFAPITFDFISDISVCPSMGGQEPSNIDFINISSGILGDWSAPQNFLDDGGDASNFNMVSFEGLASGSTYDFTFMGASNGDCPASEDIVTITVIDCDCPTLIIDSPVKLCNDGQGPVLDLNGQLSTDTAPGTWSYLNGPETDVVLGSGSMMDTEGLMEGDYQFEYTLDDPQIDCPDSGILIVEIFAPLTFDLGDNPVVCSEASIQAPSEVDFDAITTGILGDWEVPQNYLDDGGDASDLSNVSFEGLPFGSSYDFVFTGESNFACGPVSETLTISVIDCNCPNITVAGDQDLCNDGDTVDLSTLTTPSTEPGSFTAEDATGNAIDVTSGIFDATDLSAGEYVITFTPDVTPPSDCPQTDFVTFTIFEAPSTGVASMPLSFCEEETVMVDLFDLLEGETAGGQWVETSGTASTGSAFDSAAASFDMTGQATGSYTFEYIFDNNNSPCPTVATTVVIDVEGTPNADAGLDGTIDCDLLPVSLGGSGTSTGPEYSYSWMTPGGAIFSDVDLSLDATEGGEWTLIVENVLTGCTAMDVALVEVDDEVPDFQFETFDSPCNGDNEGSVSITGITGGTPPFLFSIDNGAPQEIMLFENLSPGDYELTLSDGQSCSRQYSIIIAEPGPLTYSIGNDAIIEVGEEALLGIQDNFDVSLIETAIWTQDGEVLCEGTPDECLEIVVTPPLVPTIYCLEVITSAGCSAIACRELQALDVRDVFIPNILSSLDIDGIDNTTFYVHSDSFLENINTFAIYDRWGERVFLLEDVLPNDPNSGWDGTYNGVRAAQGVYVYLIEVTYIGGETEIFTGTVTLVK